MGMGGRVRQAWENVAQQVVAHELQNSIPSGRGYEAWQMAQSPEQRQQWRAWANNPSMHNPQQMAVDPSTGKPYEHPDRFRADLNQQVYGGPMSQPVPRGTPRGRPSTPQTPGLTMPSSPKNQMLGRILRQEAK